VILIAGNVATAIADGPSAKQESQRALPARESVQSVEGKTVMRDKLDSHLLRALEQAQEGKREGAPGLASELEIVSGRVLVDVDATVSDELLLRVAELGGQVLSSTAAYHTIRAWVPLLTLDELARDPRIRFIEPAARGTTNR